MSATPSMPKCPVCKSSRQVNPHGITEFFCANCRGVFDDDPDEGGTHSSRNQAARMEREETQRARQREQNQRRRGY